MTGVAPVPTTMPRVAPVGRLLRPGARDVSSTNPSERTAS
jgi:hypothetical protein